MPEKFKVVGNAYDKRLVLQGPWDLGIEIDNDDVDHAQVKRDARKLCAILEKHWNE